ncbi:MAG: VWA domain-containing protein [Chloroflexota bacterium]|nr:MAG: VWA domain-containing protein [Chloroflexota bacterium]
MSYSAEISRTNPSCFLFVIDQSGSMADPFGGEAGKRKADGVADALNRLLQNLVIKCAKTEGVRDYYYIGVIGYGAQVGSAFLGNIAGRELVPISEVAANPARIEERTKKVEDGAGGLVEQMVKFPIWIEPIANQGTPMRKAMTMAETTLKSFVAAHPDAFPPIVIHITDGESTDGDPTEAMRNVTNIQTSDGNVLLFNVHLSSSSSQPIAYPNSSDALPDKYAQLLFDTASELTPFMLSIAREQGYDPEAGARGFVFNGDLALVIQSLDIGTRPSNLR